MELASIRKRRTRMRCLLALSVVVIASCGESAPGGTASSVSIAEAPATSVADVPATSVPVVHSPSTSFVPSMERDLMEARTRWNESGIEDYTFKAETRDCECVFGGRRLVTVIAGEVAQVHSIDVDGVFYELPTNSHLSVNGLFDFIATAISNGRLNLAEYDAQHGYPTRIDEGPMAIDVHIDMRIEAFTEGVAGQVSDPISASTATDSPPTTWPVEAADAAVWSTNPDQALTPDDQSFTALVTRLDCNGGVTGEVYAPTVSIDDAAIVVTFTVEPTPGGDCPMNDQVPFVVDVGQPIGDRQLVDGACLPGGEAMSTAFCTDGGIRR